MFCYQKRRLSSLNILKFCKNKGVSGTSEGEKEEKFWSGQGKAVPLRADYYQGKSPLWQCRVEFGRSAGCCLGN